MEDTSRNIWDQSQSRHMKDGPLTFRNDTEQQQHTGVFSTQAQASFASATQAELPFRDTVGYLSPAQTNSTIPQLFLPTSLTFKITNEIDTITSMETSNHGAFLAVGTSTGLIRLYCFGRTHRNNNILEQIEDRFAQFTTNPSTNFTDPISVPYYASTSGWDHLIHRGIDIIPIESTKQQYLQQIQPNTELTKHNLPQSLTSLSIPQSTTQNLSISTNLQTSLSNNETTSSSIQTTASSSTPSSTTTTPLLPNPLQLPFQVHELIHHQAPVTGLQFSSCLSFMLSVDTKGIICFWALSTDYSHSLQYLGSTSSSSSSSSSNVLSMNSTTTSTTSTTSTTTTTTTNALAAPTRKGKLGTKGKKDTSIASTNDSTTITMSDQPATTNTTDDASDLATSQLQSTSQITLLSASDSTLTSNNTLNPLENKPVLLRTWKSFPSAFNALSLSLAPGAGHFAVSHQSIGVSIYRTDLNEPIRLFPYYPAAKNIAHFSPGSSMVWSPNGLYLAVAFEQDAVGIYSPFDSRFKSDPIRHLRVEGRCTALAFSPCGRFLFTATTLMMMMLWDITLHPNRIWIVNPYSIQMDPILQTLLPEQLIEVTIPLQPVFLASSADSPSLSTALPVVSQQLTVPIYPNKGTIHTDFITSCAFSYPNQGQLTAQIASLKDSPMSSDTFPYLITTSSLDGTTKIWHPFFHRTLQKLQDNEIGCLLGKDLLQTIYTQQNPVHKVKYTSRNLLMILTTDDLVPNISTLREVM